METFQPVGNIDDIKVVESTPLFDARQFDGAKVKIESVVQSVVDSHYIDGVYNANKTIKSPVIEVETEPVTTIKTIEGEKQVKVKQRFSLQEVNGQVVISKNPKAKLWKFMRKMGVEKPSELKGKTVTLTAEPSTDPEDDRLWLRIVV
jgi:hypothetical protein